MLHLPAKFYKNLLASSRNRWTNVDESVTSVVEMREQMLDWFPVFHWVFLLKERHSLLFWMSQRGKTKFTSWSSAGDFKLGQYTIHEDTWKYF